jgi:hypothetical protein
MMILTFLLSLAAAEAKEPQTVTLVRISQPDNPVHRAETRYTLRREGKSLTCQTQNIPKHKIDVKGFSLNPPANLPKKMPKECKLALQWGGKKFCEDTYENLELAEVFSQCVNL